MTKEILLLRNTYAPWSLLVNKNLKSYTNMSNIVCVCAWLTVHHRNDFSTRHHHFCSPNMDIPFVVHKYAVMHLILKRRKDWTQYYHSISYYSTLKHTTSMKQGQWTLFSYTALTWLQVFCTILASFSIIFLLLLLSPSCTLSLGVPSQSLFLYGTEFCFSVHAFLQSDLHCQWFFFYYLHSYPFDTET
jgi:hypothetical protein